MDPEVPLVVPEVNADAAASHRGIVSNPNCSTIQLVCALEAAARRRRPRARHRRDLPGGVGHRSQGGRRAALAVAGCARRRARPSPSVYPHPIAFNALPQCDGFEGDSTLEETKLVRETQKILGDDTIGDPAPPACACRSGAATPRPSGSRRARRSGPTRRARSWRSAPGVRVVDDPAAAAYPLRLRRGGHRRRPRRAASAATRRAETGSRCGSSPTTCARAPRPTASRSPSSSSSATSSASPAGRRPDAGRRPGAATCAPSASARQAPGRAPSTARGGRTSCSTARRPPPRGRALPPASVRAAAARLSALPRRGGRGRRGFDCVEHGHARDAHGPFRVDELLGPTAQREAALEPRRASRAGRAHAATPQRHAAARAPVAGRRADVRGSWPPPPSWRRRSPSWRARRPGWSAIGVVVGCLRAARRLDVTAILSPGLADCVR